MWHDIQKLKRAGYVVIEQSPYHYHVHNNGRELINVWPSKRKWMIQYGNGASFYTDVLKMAQDILGEPGKKRKCRLKERQAEMMAEWESWRTDEEREREWKFKEDKAILMELLTDDFSTVYPRKTVAQAG